MKDTLDFPIEAGDILVQGSGSWGLYFYEVIEDPDTTPRLNVFDLQNDNIKKSLSKRESYYMNLTKSFGERFSREELLKIARL